VGRDGHSVAAVARDVGVGWATVMAAVVDYGTPVIERPDRIDGVAAVGVDETAFLRALPGRSSVFATGIVDLHGGKLIDIIEGRSRKVLADWLIDQPAEWVAGIQVAALDPFRGYGAALSAGLPHAVRVLDAFHVVPLGFAAVDDVRRRVQQHTCGHRRRRDDPLYGIRRVLRRGAEHLTTTGWARLLAGIEAGDHDGQVAAAWVAAQELRDSTHHCDRRSGRFGLLLPTPHQEVLVSALTCQVIVIMAQQLALSQRGRVMRKRPPPRVLRCRNILICKRVVKQMVLYDQQTAGLCRCD
jgi:transposase